VRHEARRTRERRGEMLQLLFCFTFARQLNKGGWRQTGNSLSLSRDSLCVVIFTGSFFNYNGYRDLMYKFFIIIKLRPLIFYQTNQIKNISFKEFILLFREYRSPDKHDDTDTWQLN
jgi:hypothetical protein